MSKSFRPIHGVPHARLTIAQAAQLTSLSRKTIEEALDKGELSSVMSLRRVTLIPADALERWFNSLMAGGREPVAVSRLTARVGLNEEETGAAMRTVEQPVTLDVVGAFLQEEAAAKEAK